MAGRLDDSDELTETHDINVTPFIDVVLVLLIIFMVAAPLATVDVAVDLPTSDARPQPRPETPLFLTLKADLTLAIGNNPITDEQLVAELERETGGDKEQRIYLRADRTVDYGDLMDLMNRLRGSGYSKIALVGQEVAP